MVLHFLQVASDPPVLPNLQALYPEYFSYDNNLEEFELFANLPKNLPDAPRNTKRVGELLIAFFDYYTSFDFDNWAISIQRGSELAENTRRFKVYIEEPFDHQNTARCITSDDQWDIIMEVFNEARSCFFGPRSNDPPSLRMLQVPES
ncbi:cid1 family poly A polymerase domain-containing protein [Ditylenchus destructor]|nr:cid1 family poly A polymerase domain-containing protein [Ditylenchus destructor]